MVSVMLSWNVNVNLKLIHTATPDTTRLSRLPVDHPRRDAGQAGRQLRLAARPPTRSDVVRRENVNTLWTVACD